MNGGGEGGAGGEGGVEAMEEEKERIALMWGYLPGAFPQRTPLLSPVPVTLPRSTAGDAWRDVCGGGCGFAMAISAHGEVYTWGWKECVPSGKVTGDQSAGGLRLLEKDALERQSTLLSDQVSPRSQGPKSGEESTKRRRTSSSKQSPECSSGDENLSAVPCLVTLGPGVRIINVAAGGRHTLALSDTGALLTFGWGLYGQH